MPTPDTEALAARLRAVERALTDDETTLDEAASERPPEEPLDGTRHAAAGSPPTDSVRTDGAGTGIERRLTRLEAAVQALRAALDANGSDAEKRRESDPDTGPPEAVTASAATRATDRDRSRPTGRPEHDWPDDLTDGA